MQEVWKFHDHTVYLICEYVNKGKYVFTAKPADLDSAEAAKVLTKLSLHLRSIGITERGIFRAMPKILAEAPGWHLANQNICQSSHDRFSY